MRVIPRRRPSYNNRFTPDYLKDVPSLSERARQALIANDHGESELVDSELQAICATIKERKLRMEGILQ